MSLNVGRSRFLEEKIEETFHQYHTRWLNRTHDLMITGSRLTAAIQLYPWARYEPGHSLTTPMCKISTGR